MTHYYMLFDNHTDGLAMYNQLRELGIKAAISPTPRQLSICCGISLLLQEEDLEHIKEIAEDHKLNYIKIEGLNNSFDNNRGKFC